jgi:hypothetical protein
VSTTLENIIPSSSGQDLGTPSQQWDVFAQTITLNGVSIITGTGTPSGVVSATPGSLYLNLSGGTSTTLYVKESGSGTSGWVAK